LQAPAGKKLLVLGAGHFQIPVIRCAQRLGCHVISLDYLPDNPGHQIANEYEIVSTVDLDRVLAVARLHRIDGILTYGSDVSAPAVTYVAEKMGLPGNPYSAGRLLQRKDLFRKLQRELALPHPDFCSGISAEAIGNAIRKHRIPFPIVVKPADSSGSKGLGIVQNHDEIGQAFTRASQFSRCGMVVAERYLLPDIPEVVGDIFIQYGKLAFRHYGHNFFRPGLGVPVPVGEIMPALFDREMGLEIDRQFTRLIDELGLSCGCLNFDAIISGETFHIIDIGLRNGGNYFADLIKLSTGFDLTEAAIHGALGADYPCPYKYVDDAVPVLSYVLNAREDGTFAGVRISKRVESFIAESVVFTEVGSAARDYISGDRALGVFLLRLPNKETAWEVADSIDEHIMVELR
jgi:biotin carboxylase